jgi:hypothetical protein
VLDRHGNLPRRRATRVSTFACHRFRPATGGTHWLPASCRAPRCRSLAGGRLTRTRSASSAPCFSLRAEQLDRRHERGEGPLLLPDSSGRANATLCVAAPSPKRSPSRSNASGECSWLRAWSCTPTRGGAASGGQEPLPKGRHMGPRRCSPLLSRRSPGWSRDTTCCVQPLGQAARPLAAATLVPTSMSGRQVRHARLLHDVLLADVSGRAADGAAAARYRCRGHAALACSSSVERVGFGALWQRWLALASLS